MTAGRGVINRDGVRRLAKREGAQVSEAAIDLLEVEAAELVQAAARRARALGRRRVTEGVLRGTDPP